jgi:serine/threonine protein kinase
VVNGELPNAPPGLGVGSHLADYLIEEQIGRGGMAVVYRASDTRLNRSVALKILAPDLAGDTAFRQRFMREMRAAAAVDHPHIVPVFDAGEAGGVLYIAMRYVRGQDLRTLLDTVHTLPPTRVARIIAQVASALDDAHARGLIHRDVKPGNMLIGTVSGSGQPDHVYLSDFGLSKPAISGANLTLTGQFLGTLDYMAPEQVEGHAVDGRADLYSLACTAFEMLAGEPPFKRDQGFAVLWAQLSAPAPSLCALRPELPPAVDHVIARALAKSPADRYRTCAEFASALGAACAGTPGTGPPQAWPPRAAPDWPSPPPPTRQAPPPMRQAPPPMRQAPPPMRRPPGRGAQGRRKGPRVAAAIAFILIIAIAAVVGLLLRKHPSTPNGTPGSSSTATVPATAVLGPAATVRAYYAAINDHDYPRAWTLIGGNASQTADYDAFVQGFNGTRRDNVTIVSVAGDVVTVRLAAAQTSGAVHHYQGTYTVTGGTITHSDIHPG